MTGQAMAIAMMGGLAGLTVVLAAGVVIWVRAQLVGTTAVGHAQSLLDERRPDAVVAEIGVHDTVAWLEVVPPDHVAPSDHADDLEPVGVGSEQRSGAA